MRLLLHFCLPKEGLEWHYQDPGVDPKFSPRLKKNVKFIDGIRDLTFTPERKIRQNLGMGCNIGRKRHSG